MPQRCLGGMRRETWPRDLEAGARWEKSPSCARINRLKPTPPKQSAALGWTRQSLIPQHSDAESMSCEWVSGRTRDRHGDAWIHAAVDDILLLTEGGDCSGVAVYEPEAVSLRWVSTLGRATGRG